MGIKLLIHLEETDSPESPAGDGGVVWWAESPDVPGFSAVGTNLAELRERVSELLTSLGHHDAAITEELVSDEDEARVVVVRSLVPC